MAQGSHGRWGATRPSSALTTEMTLILAAFSTLAIVVLVLRLAIAFYVGATRPPKALLQQRRRDLKRPLRVAFVHPDFGIGGAENLVVNAAIALQKKGAEVTIFTAHHDVSHCFEETRGNGPLVACVRVHGDWLPKTIAGKGYAFCAILRVLYVTLVIGTRHADDIDVFFVDQVSISIPFLRSLGKPVLFYGHYPDKLLVVKSSSPLKRLYRYPLDTLEEITTACSDAILVNSAFTRSVFQRSFTRLAQRDLGILYPPVDVSVFERFEPSMSRNLLQFVSLNRFERKKNVALAIHALAKLKALVPADVFDGVKLVVAGGYDPNNTENIEHLEELKIEVAKFDLARHVEFRTSVSDLMKKELLATSAAVLYTPDKEHFGIVPVEAMTCSTPVIAVASGGPLESIKDGDTGFLCKDEPEAFAAAMAKVCSATNAERVKEMGEKGKKRARALFSLETFADSLFASVTDLVQPASE